MGPTMERRPILSRLTSGFVCLAALWAVASFLLPDRAARISHRALAVPHTVRRDVEHPFDPDWPDVYLMLNAKCSRCHRPGGEQYDLTTYEGLLAARDASGQPLVVPGDPEQSPLWQALVWNHAAQVDSQLPDEPLMPPEPAEWLTGGQLETLARWIRNGALEYALPATCSTRPLLQIDFPSAKQCRACHPKQYDEWSRSMHHYAQHSPIFEAFNLALLERTSGTLGTFCSRCHTPLGTALGENGLRRNVHRSRLSMEGITCVVCHRVGPNYYKSNGRLAIEPGALPDGCLYGPFEDSVSASLEAHDSRAKPFIKTSAFCGTCHDVNNPQGLRLEEAFSEWQNSPAARRGITCQACHMGPEPGVPIPDDQRPWGRAAEVPGVDPERIPLRPLSNHTFTGPDYSLLPDTEFPHKLDWMYEHDYRDTANLTPHQQRTLDDLRRSNRRHLRIAAEQRYRLLQRSARLTVHSPQHARPGQRVSVRVDVKNLVAGHNFPTGFTAERQLWVELTVWDPRGRVIFRTGDLDANGDLRDEHSHAVAAGHLPRDRYLTNFQNYFTALTNRGTERTVVLSVNRHLRPINILRPATGIAMSIGRPAGFRIAKASIAPLATATCRYPIWLSDCEGPHRLLVRLNFRNLPPILLDEIGTPHLKKLLEIVVIDQFESFIYVSRRDGASVVGCKPLASPPPATHRETAADDKAPVLTPAVQQALEARQRQLESGVVGRLIAPPPVPQVSSPPQAAAIGKRR